ncbi:MAG: hypothetical protein EPN30_06430 [Actinomycetota bacterium]|nr:MAG: hypothetical protein EPN30_06430 [Actinomycetota bacterium]
MANDANGHHPNKPTAPAGQAVLPVGQEFFLQLVEKPNRTGFVSASLCPIGHHGLQTDILKRRKASCIGAPTLMCQEPVSAASACVI